jgi:murein DD-endopeptidase MepM/ murein hydrolase activator NlpD
MKRFSFLALMMGLALISFSFTSKPATKGTRSKKAKTKVSKALAFPVAGKKSNIGSFWGASRDGGARSHKGIDIFAKKGTPVVAISDGVIVDKGVSPRGGRILWLKSANHPWSAYYAHLDKWAVNEGQRVRKGQVLGTVGNTGNARTTPSHLHFGIYKTTGPVNPLPIVKKATKVPAPKATTKKKKSNKKKTSSAKKRTRK